MKRWPLNTTPFWESAPFFRALVPFIAGTCLYDTCLSEGWSAAYLPITLLLAIAIVTFLFFYKRNSLPGFLLVNGIMLLSAIMLSHLSDVRTDSNWFGHHINNKAAYVLEITAPPAEKENSWKLPVAVRGMIDDGKFSAQSGNALVYVYKGDMPMLLHTGDTILAPGNWEPIQNAGNPFEFDYATYCRRNNLFYRQICAMSAIRLYATNNPEAAPPTVRMHDWCMAQLDTYIQDAKIKGLIQAMVIGDEANLDADIRRSYSETGVVHIIAISGGNVGIFFSFISLFLFWSKGARHQWIKLLLALPLAWFYVFMAGAPASAVRAVVMVSLVAAGSILEKDRNSLNTLFATAFILLCAEPMWLFSIGFQLSFVAVLSLIIFYSPVLSWVKTKNKVSHFLWSAVAASMAAEMLVAPIVIYYFHIFPIMFLPANVSACLFMGIVLILGIAIIMFSGIPVIANFIGWVVTALASGFNKIISGMQSLNPASLLHIKITGPELALIFTVISAFTVLFLYRKKHALWIGLSALCCLLISFCIGEWAVMHTRKLVVYNTPKSNCIELLCAGIYQSYIDSLDGKYYATDAAHTGWGCWKKDSSKMNEFFTTGNKTAFILNHAVTNDDQPMPVSYLIINFTGHPDPYMLKKVFNPSLVVIGNNYSLKQQDNIAADFTKAGIAVHITRRNGAFVIE